MRLSPYGLKMTPKGKGRDDLIFVFDLPGNTKCCEMCILGRERDKMK
jgi:hypothetical protein